MGPSGSERVPWSMRFSFLKQVVGLNPDAPNPFARWGRYEKVVFMNIKE